jgi:tripartite-type tricarboxylate transporter receptor subunit TctC
MTTKKAILIASAGALIAGTPAAASDFYSQKTITITVGLGAGGSYDLYSRMLARHMGAHIPGNPNFVVQNRPGAGGMLAYNQASRGPRDGTLITSVSQGLLLQEVIGLPGLEASLGSFNWIGNFTQENNVTVTWHTSPVKTIHDARSREVPLAASGAGSTSAQLAGLYNNLLGTRFKAVMGYESGAQQTLAMERGEMEGRATNTWSSYKASFPDPKSKLNVLVQIGLRREADLPEVPLLSDLVKGDPDKEKVARLVSESLAVARPFAAPPGVPEDRVTILRRGFEGALADPALIAEAAKLRLDLSPMTGSEVQSIIKSALGTEQKTKDLVAKLFR